MGALGCGLPSTALVVSPQHRILVRSKIAQRIFGAQEVLVAAKHLLEVEGIAVAEDVTEVTYFHFLCDRHEIVIANGALTESMYTGPEALKNVSSEAREEILMIFPELAEVNYEAMAARPLVKGRTARQLAFRHSKNVKALFSGTLH